MTRSPEWPDLPWIPARWYTTGRGGATNVPRVIVVHHTAGSETPTSAEDGASYDQHRLEKVSAHYYVDADSVVQCVRTTDTAYTAYPTGNRIGIHYELCGTLQTRAQWLDRASDATLSQAARQMARDAAKYGIPARHLSVDQLRSGAYGFAGHGDITRAFGQGTHTDPGPDFPWDILLDRVTTNLRGTDMTHILIRHPDRPEVYRADGITRYHLPNDAALATTRTIGTLADDGEIRLVDDLDAYGVDITAMSREAASIGMVAQALTLIEALAAAATTLTAPIADDTP